MKNFVIIVLLAFTLSTGSAFSFEGNRGPPEDSIKVTFADVLEQSNHYTSLGWEVMGIQSIRFQEEDFFIMIIYERLDDHFALSTEVIENFNIKDFQDLRYTILSQRRKPEKNKFQTKFGMIIGSSCGVPYWRLT